MLNQCLVQRMLSESRFEQLGRLIGILMTKTDEVFNATFDRARIQILISEAEHTDEDGKEN